MANFWTNIHKQNDFLLFLHKADKDLILTYALPETAIEFDDYWSTRK